MTVGVSLDDEGTNKLEPGKGSAFEAAALMAIAAGEAGISDSALLGV
jgi:hypothetical protein